MYIIGSARFQLPENGLDGSAEVREGAHQAEALVQAVDFPDFVAGLVNGVFNANVDASIRQMEAYGELVQGVSKSADEFAKHTVAEGVVRPHPWDDD